MFKIAKYSICILIILAFMVSTLTAFGYPGAWNPYQKKETSEIKELKIKNSGFRSQASVIIRYRDKDKKIVAVIENGKELPASEFSRYESVVHEVLELPRINKLLPEVDEALRRVASSEILDQARLDRTRQLMRRLERMNSETALRTRDIAAAQLLDVYYRAIEKLSKSKELSQQEKIEELKRAFQQIRDMEQFRDINKKQTAALDEFQVAEAARRLMAEINKSSDISQEEKFRELKEVYKQMQHMEQAKAQDRRHTELVAFELVKAVQRKMQDIAQKQEFSDQEKQQEYERLFREFNEIKSESLQRMIGIEKFKLDLHQLLKKEGLFPEKKAEFVLKKGECTIEGKKLPKDLYEKIMQLCQESLGKKFTKDTKIVLQLKEQR